MELLNILLQIDPAGNIWQRLGDQAFSILVLVVIARILWKRQIKLEDRLTQYLDEDRDKMMGVIDNNTKVMERLEEVLDSNHPKM
ncbi:hypothetical protein HGH92_21585 [Chitinophaga varians]|uniref:Uncharacterized protein n=1 Tax=Chitinophaga varians TaxID=2202339 RepID=A0A847S0K4_9BACT|nr:hypothetical protein [Chitinophaga varians]MBC9915023.1 hypothetical protein [Chitinophaga varians]NLR66915.1 hypothetical protein [Chitinophaga varians]